MVVGLDVVGTVQLTIRLNLKHFKEAFGMNQEHSVQARSEELHVVQEAYRSEADRLFLVELHHFELHFSTQRQQERLLGLFAVGALQHEYSLPMIRDTSVNPLKGLSLQEDDGTFVTAHCHQLLLQVRLSAVWLLPALRLRVHPPNDFRVEAGWHHLQELDDDSRLVELVLLLVHELVDVVHALYLA